MRRLLCLVGLAACYAPAAHPGAPCDPATDQCPSGQSCTATGEGYFCLGRGAGGGGEPDASVPDPGGDSAPPGDVGDFCYGTGLVRVCFPQQPTGTITINAATTVNTAMVGGTNCSQIVGQPSGPSLCVIAAQLIEIKPGHVLDVTGANPLVLVATDAIKIEGALDASSHRGGLTGPGAQAACAAGIDGENNNQDRGGGGGSFGTLGGTGGDGNGGQSSGGTASGIMAPAVLVGGCPGGEGGNNGPIGGGPGGAGGGAVYLIAASSISVPIGGSVHASGAGGGRGGAGLNASGAGGGGGAGGMIGLDAPNISIAGIVVANGAGGGGGGGNDPAFVGAPGAEPTSPIARAAGGNGGNNGGGDGGDGFARGQPAQNASNGSNQYCGGGGGGGGGGIVRVFGVPASSLGATISPAPI